MTVHGHDVVTDVILKYIESSDEDDQLPME